MTSPRCKLVDPTTPGYYHCAKQHEEQHDTHQHEDIHEVADFLQRDAAIADYRSATRLPSCSHDLTAQPAG